MTAMNTGDREVDAKVAEWLEWDQNENTRREIESLLAKKDVAELRKRLCVRMAFGTAGLRARMGAGNSEMNDLTIIQTAQGFVKYMLAESANVVNEGVIIGFDARHNSQRWAEISASIFISQGIPVYLFRSITPTPFVPYGILKLGCRWGVMVTASHNPKWDNGYKVYYRNGAQIISPHDKEISKHITQNLKPWPESWNLSGIRSSKLFTEPYDKIYTSYFEDLKSLCYMRSQNSNTPLKFTYTAMHGVGLKFLEETFKVFGFEPFIPVTQQVEPDPEFSTVEFPNPEEGKSALHLAIETANANGSTVILANDPDADRLAVAEKLPDGLWHVFNGNEVGALIGWWLFHVCKLTNKPFNASDCYFLASTVSSKILKTIATKEGFNFVETLTGFKWMGNMTSDLMKQGKTVVFAFEEAIGFMCGTNVLDKDGVSAAGVVAEMAAYVSSQGITLKQQLENIYIKYGFHVSSNSYFLCYDPVVIKQVFERLRNYDGPGKYPQKLGRFEIKYVRDLTTGYDNNQPDEKAILPVSKSSQMITFTFTNGCVITMRTSGTEPKIKYYSELCADPARGMSREDAESELQEMVVLLRQDFFEPEKNNLRAKSD